MQRLKLGQFIKAYQNISAFNQALITTREMNQNLKVTNMGLSDFKEMMKSLDSLVSIFDEAGMNLSSISAKAALAVAEQVPVIDKHAELDISAMIKIQAQITDMQSRARDEFVTRYVLVMPPSKIDYYDPTKPRFGKDADLKFSTAADDIKEAEKCFALARYTATVFHLMRVMEIGVRSVARCLAVPDPTKPAERNWGFVLREINTAIKSKQKTLSISDQDFFDSVYIALDKVRSLWRNPTMHVERKYDEEEANEILEAVRIFVRKLASRLDQDGKPLA